MKMFAAAAALALVALVSRSASAADTIVGIAAGNKDFSTLVTAVKQAGLAEALSGKGPFTVFAPTNEAFAKIPKEKLDAILADKKLLITILTYHVVPGKVMAADVAKLKDGTKVKTLQGGSITVGLKGGVTVDKAKVIKTDIVGSNGVIHVIDTVIVPSSK